jgi:DNA (cytosine-5)-methyltransferase 1
MTSSVVDLYCGVGGLTYGFKREGFNVIAGIDTDPRCAYAYEANTGAEFLERDVGAVSTRYVGGLYPKGDLRILAGCAPCQPFSLYRNGKSRGEKWRLLRAFADLAVSIRPEIVTMENVPQLTRYRVFEDFVRSLNAAGYWTTWYLARGPLYGVPQRRIRLVLFASRLGAIELLPPTHSAANAPTVRDAIGGLERISAGGACKHDRLHRARNLSELNQRRIAATPMGGWWDEWDESLQLRCHRKQKGKSYRTVYGRMDWDRPSPTITTQCIGLGNGQFGHPVQNRAISLREAALLQTFPKKYKFVRPSARVSLQTVALQIGNAVPVRLAQIVARSIRHHLKLCGAS